MRDAAEHLKVPPARGPQIQDGVISPLPERIEERGKSR